MTCVTNTTSNSLTIQQYSNATRLKALIAAFLDLIQKQMLNPLCDFEHGLSIDNAYGWLLNRIGDNHGYTRPALPQGVFDYWGFDFNGTNYDRSPYFYGSKEPLLPASDDLYRKLLKAWLKGLFYDGSVHEANEALCYAFGKGYLIDYENRTADVVIYDQDYTTMYSIIKTGIIPKVAGVRYYHYIMRKSNTPVFGFAGSDEETFNQASFQRSINSGDIQ